MRRASKAIFIETFDFIIDNRVVSGIPSCRIVTSQRERNGSVPVRQRPETSFPPVQDYTHTMPSIVDSFIIRSCIRSTIRVICVRCVLLYLWIKTNNKNKQSDQFRNLLVLMEMLRELVDYEMRCDDEMRSVLL